MEIFGRQLKEKILSLPIVVTVHGSQETNAWATILWDNAFARTNRQYFAVSDTISWKEFGQALSYKFHSVTGRGLTDENLHFLAEKFFDQPVPFPVSETHQVTWTNFCKEKLPLRDFSLWILTNFLRFKQWL
jgi:signal transducer and activator of transcription 5B